MIPLKINAWYNRTMNKCACGCGKEVKKTFAPGHHWKTRPSVRADPTYHAWCEMRYRCSNPNIREWKRYGGRGISVCKRWRKSFKAFLEDMGPKPVGLSLDRKNFDGNYEPSNCRWATASEQANNTSRNFIITAIGKTQTLSQWSSELGMCKNTLRNRILKGWPPDLAVGQKVHPRFKGTGKLFNAQ